MDKVSEAKSALGKIKQLRIKNQQVRDDLTEKKNEIIGAEILQELQDLEDEYQGIFTAFSERENELIKQVKDLVLQIKSSQKIDGLQAVYTPEGVKWNTQALVGYAADKPELEQFKEKKSASVAIR